MPGDPSNRDLPPFPQRPELLMPVSDEHAIRQFELEALRQITDNLKRLNDGQAEQGRTLNSIDRRLVRIESNSVNTDVATLKQKVDELEADRDRRAGAVSLIEWLVKHWPALIGFALLVALILRANGMIGGERHLTPGTTAEPKSAAPLPAPPQP